MRSLALALIAFAGSFSSATAQVVIGTEAALNNVSSSGGTLTELVVPLGVTWSFGRVQLDANTAFAHARLDRDDGSTHLSGVTDLTLRATTSLLADRVRVILSGNVPTGTESVDSAQLNLAAALATDLFTMPVSSFGSGAGFTGALAFAQPVGSWVLGILGAYRIGNAYEPFVASATTPSLEYRPGQELRVRIAADRPTRSGWSTRFGVSWSRFGRDEVSGTEIAAAGDRVLGEALVEFPFARGNGVAYAWNLYRMKGEELESLPPEPARNLLGAGVRVAVPVGSASLRPLAELLVQSTAADEAALVQSDDGVLGRFGSGVAFRLGSFVVEPAAVAQIGRLNGATLTGFIARLGVAWAR